MNDSPIFIVGTARSGTTLLARILGSHSRLFMPGETHFFGDIYAQRQVIGNLDEAQARARLADRLSTLYGRYNEPEDQRRVEALRAGGGFLAEDAALHSYRAALDHFMTLQMSAQGKQRWGNNVPKDLFHIEDILGFYPRAKFIVCFRDVRDFLNSYKSRWRVTAPEQRDRVARLYHPVVTSLLWKASVRRLPGLRRHLDAEQLHVLRYEDLVTRPADTVRALCDYLGESFEPQLLEVEYSNSSRGGPARKIDASSVGAWRDALSAEEVWLAQRIAGGEMRSLAYAPETVAASYSKLAYQLLSAPRAALSALSANRANNGPLLPYLANRVRSLLRA